MSDIDFDNCSLGEQCFFLAWIALGTASGVATFMHVISVMPAESLWTFVVGLALAVATGWMTGFLLFLLCYLPPLLLWGIGCGIKSARSSFGGACESAQRRNARIDARGRR